MWHRLLYEVGTASYAMTRKVTRYGPSSQSTRCCGLSSADAIFRGSWSCDLGQNADATRHFRPFERVLSSHHLASPSRQQARGQPAEIQGLKTASTLGSKTTGGGDSGGEVNWQIGPLGRTLDAVPTAGSPGRTHDMHASFRGGDKLSEALDWKLQNIITSWRPLRSGRSETRSLELGG